MQVKHNKHELLEMIEQVGSGPLTRESIRNLAALGSAYDALCLLHPDEDEAEHMGYPERVPHPGRMEPAQPAVHP